MRAESVSGQIGQWVEVGVKPRGTVEYDDGHADRDLAYVYKILAVNQLADNGTVLWEAITESEVTGPINSTRQWFHTGRINIFVMVVILSALIIFYINQAKAGKKLFIRKIAGLEAVDEAVGRATEMGRKIFYVPGSQDMDNVQTLAGLTILGSISEMIAEYETSLVMPTSRFQCSVQLHSRAAERPVPRVDRAA